jgi:hypothetical protein
LGRAHGELIWLPLMAMLGYTLTAGARCYSDSLFLD